MRIPRQLDKIPGVELSIYEAQWKKLSIDGLLQKSADYQDMYFTVQGSSALENQLRLIMEALTKHIQKRYEKEAVDQDKRLGI